VFDFQLIVASFADKNNEKPENPAPASAASLRDRSLFSSQLELIREQDGELTLDLAS